MVTAIVELPLAARFSLMDVFVAHRKLIKLAVPDPGTRLPVTAILLGEQATAGVIIAAMVVNATAGAGVYSVQAPSLDCPFTCTYEKNVV